MNIEDDNNETSGSDEAGGLGQISVKALILHLLIYYTLTPRSKDNYLPH